MHMSIVENRQSTDATGRCFICYKRSRLATEIRPLIRALHEHGIPTWQDVSDLESRPTEAGITEALNDPQTAGAVIWLTPDVEGSSVIREVEAPGIFRRESKKDGFWAEVCVAGGLDYAGATKVLNGPAFSIDLAASWNLRLIKDDPASGQAIADVAEAVLHRRLAAIHGQLPEGAPLRLAFYAHGKAALARNAGDALAVNWINHFQERYAHPATWTTSLLPALDTISRAVRSDAPGRPVLAIGFASLSAAMALGRAFMEPSGIAISWRPATSAEPWSLRDDDRHDGFCATLDANDSKATDLAVLVSITNPVQPAFAVTADLPAFRALLRIGAPDGQGGKIHDGRHASGVARLVAAEMRRAKTQFPAIRKCHVFLSGPIGLAMLIGQQLNALGPVQSYEHRMTSDDGVGTYVPAALLCDTN